MVNAILRIDERTANVRTPSRQPSVQVWAAGLLISALLGMGLGASGLGIGFFSGLWASDADLSRLGSVLILMAFLLFQLAAHCIDKASDARRKFRRSRQDNYLCRDYDSLGTGEL